MADKPNVVPSGFIKIPLIDAALGELSGAVEDDAWWHETMPPILLHYKQITPEIYWQLTAREHALLFGWLEKIGVVKNGNDPET